MFTITGLDYIILDKRKKVNKYNNDMPNLQIPNINH